MNKAKVNIWGREFELEICYDCFEDEAVSDVQKEAVKQFITRKDISFESLDEVKKYCLNGNIEKIGCENISNIFKYVLPASLYIKGDNEKRILAIMCDYKFDMEHGLAVVYENEKLKEIGEQSAVL